MEVCADDRWYVAVVSGVTAIDSQEEQSISLQLQGVTSTSVTITWSLDSLLSSVLNNKSTSITCRAAFLQASYEVKIFASDATTVQITRLIPDTTFDCCVNVHGAKSLINLPFTLITSGCVRIRTLPSDPCNHSVIIAFSSSIFLVFVCVALIAFILKQKYTKVKPPKM